MAYLFNLSPSEDNEKANIFGGDSGGQQQQPPDSDDKGSSSDIFSSAPSGSGGGGSVGSGGSSQQMSQPKASGGYNPKAANQAFQSAAQGIQQPKKLGEAQGTLASASQKLQEKANSYQQSATDKAKTYDVSDETLKGAAAGTKDAYQAVQDRLRKESADQFQSFEGLGKDEPNVDYVRDPGKLFASEVGQYTGGQSRFDGALLRKNQNFVQNQQEVLASEKRLRDQDAAARESETKKANDLLGSAFKQSTDAIRGKLGGYADEVVNAARAKEKAEDERRSKLDAKALSSADQARIKQQIRDDLKAADPRSQQARALRYLDEDFDLSQYADVDRDTDWQEFLNQDDADRYNRIGGLLGNGDLLQAGKGPGAEYKLRDADAYRAILGQIQGKRQAKDQQSQAEFDAIRKAAEARAASYQGRDSAQNAKDAARRDLLQYVTGRYAQSPEQTAQAQRYLTSMFDNPSQYDLVTAQGLVRENGPLSWQDVLTADELSQANQLSEDLGSLDRYKGGYRPEYDIEALKAYYDRSVGDTLNTRYAPPPPQRPTLSQPSPAKTKKPYDDLR